jgi:ubiquinone/menaquinone biosynthesis C-methylase UbiE
MMSFYSERVVPHLINLAMRNKKLAAYRGRLVPAAQGRVLEIGIGSGENLPFYSGSVREVIGLDPSASLIRLAQARARGTKVPVDFMEASAEVIPLEDASFDTALMTWALCSIPNAGSALTEIRRVLKPDGVLLFVEHGRAPDQSVARWQDWATPVWKPLAGGCHLNRKIDDLITQSGLNIREMQVGYMAGPKPFTFMYEGRASKR